MHKSRSINVNEFVNDSNVKSYGKFGSDGLFLRGSIVYSSVDKYFA
jgi:hypothetical protein